MLILGLDIGTTSIGWSLIEDHGESGKIIASGSRIFPEGVDRDQQGGEQSKTQTRREKRGMRRQIARRARRKHQLRELLVNTGLLPTSPEALDDLIGMNPYPLRRRGLDERLDLHEFGRTLLHLNQRRGFKSNRKTDKARAKEEKGMLAEINDLAARIEQTQCRTLGEYLAKLSDGDVAPIDGSSERIRNRHTRRDMYEHEFDVLWKAQANYHPDVLTQEFKAQVERIIFFQRDLYWPKSVIGRCDLEPRLKRCPVADRIAQRFRIVQEINNLKIIDRSTGEERRLTPDERAIVLAELSKSKERTFDQLRKKLGFSDVVRFNFEADDGGGRSKLKGHLTDCALAKKQTKKSEGVLGNDYWDLDERSRDRIVAILIDEDSEERALELLQTRCGLTAEQAQRALGANIPDGYSSLSKHAIRRLLPHLERGLFMMGNDPSDSALHAAGYLRPDEREVNREDFLSDSPDLPNPIVRRALVEVRKVVNGVIRTYCKGRLDDGKPPFDSIRVELAREAKKGLAQRTEIRFDNAKRRREREVAKAEIEEAGDKATRSKIQAYLLWQEQRRECIYTGRCISLTQLLSDAVDVDHILPRWRSLDDSMMNKVVAFREANAEKGNKTPREWLESEKGRYDEVLLRAKRLPYPKYRRFVQEDVELDHFVARQLTDTAYISRCVSQYLRRLGAEMVMPRGSMTAELRRRWKLNNILSDDGEKTRADHRHHAVDALAIALTDRKRLHALANNRGKLEMPWPDLRDQAERSILGINVSHRVLRRLSGALHEETFYGPTQKDPQDAEVKPGSVGNGIDRRHATGWTEDAGTFARRKPVEEIKNAKHLEKVRDPALQRVLATHLQSQGVDAYAPGAYPKDAFKGEHAPMMPSGVPIRKVRMLENKTTLVPASERRAFQWVQPGNNHHIVYREQQTKKGIVWNADVITMWEATIRGRTEKLPLVDQTPETEDGRFVMSLAIGELFEIDGEDGKRLLCVVRKMAQGNSYLYYKLHIDARTAGELKPENLYLSPKAMQQRKARKVTVDPVGRIRWAGD